MKRSRRASILLALLLLTLLLAPAQAWAAGQADTPVRLLLVDAEGTDHDSVVERFTAQGAEVEETSDLSGISPEDYDGLVLPGGAPDVDPSRYGEQRAGASKGNRALDELQFEALDLFVGSGKPVLGICRGCQVINVWFGGSLIQDLGRKGSDSIHWGGQLHSVEVKPTSRLALLYGASFDALSYHHQAVKELGEGLCAVAWAEDGVVEAIEHESLPVYGVQFHPESKKMVGTPIFHEFVRICAEERSNEQPQPSLFGWLW